MEMLATLLLCGWLLGTDNNNYQQSSSSLNYGDGNVHLYQTYEKYYYGANFPEPKRKWVWSR